MNTSLYVLAGEYLAIANKLNDSDLDEQTIADTLEGLSGELEVKATNVAMFIKNLEAQAEAIKVAEKQMAERRKAIEKKAEQINQYLKENMQRTGISLIECPYFALKLKNNPPSVIVDNVEAIPDEFMVQPPPPPKQPDKKLIGDKLKAGEDVAGCHLHHGQRLEIK